MIIIIIIIIIYYERGFGRHPTSIYGEILPLPRVRRHHNDGSRGFRFVCGAEGAREGRASARDAVRVLDDAVTDTRQFITRHRNARHVRRRRLAISAQ